MYETAPMVQAGSPGETRQLFRLMQLFAAQLEPAQALEVAAVYPEFTPGAVYQTGDYLRWGYNRVGDPQLYQVTLDHRASPEAPPERTPELYEPLGLDDRGIPLWSRPAGPGDGYRPGDVVSFRGRLCRCLAADCQASPEEAPGAWRPLPCASGQ